MNLIRWIIAVIRDARRLERLVTNRDIRQIRAAMIYALLATRPLDRKNKNSGYDWLSSEQPETPQKINLAAVCGGSGYHERKNKK